MSSKKINEPTLLPIDPEGSETYIPYSLRRFYTQRNENHGRFINSVRRVAAGTHTKGDKNLVKKLKNEIHFDADIVDEQDAALKLLSFLEDKNLGVYLLNKFCICPRKQGIDEDSQIRFLRHGRPDFAFEAPTKNGKNALFIGETALTSQRTMSKKEGKSIDLVCTKDGKIIPCTLKHTHGGGGSQTNQRDDAIKSARNAVDLLIHSNAALHGFVILFDADTPLEVRKKHKQVQDAIDDQLSAAKLSMTQKDYISQRVRVCESDNFIKTVNDIFSLP